MGNEVLPGKVAYDEEDDEDNQADQEDQEQRGTSLVWRGSFRIGGLPRGSQLERVISDSWRGWRNICNGQPRALLSRAVRGGFWARMVCIPDG